MKWRVRRVWNSYRFAYEWKGRCIGHPKNLGFILAEGSLADAINYALAIPVGILG